MYTHRSPSNKQQNKHMLADLLSLASETYFEREMRYSGAGFVRRSNVLFIRSIMILFISCVTIRMNFCFSSNSSSLRILSIDGHFEFDKVENAMKDFGNRYQYRPKAVLHPKAVADISTTLKHIWQMGPRSELTVAARGHGHSLHGQSQAHQGVVISMESLRFPQIQVYMGNSPHVDVSGGELWINICSEEQNRVLFHSVLGGLGQFGIITRAKILLEPAPEMVKWIRVLYMDFMTFTKDQEHLISAENSFDYIEGFVIINRTGLLNNWRTTFNPQDPVQASQFQSDGRTLFCLELAKYFNTADDEIVDKEIESLLSQLSYIRSTLFLSEVSYVDFLDRVHASEIKLRSKGLWEVPHPWLNLLIPKSKIQIFAEAVFGNILTKTSNGPILIYPVNKSKWDNRTSVVIPDEEIFYLVAFLTSAVPTSTGTDGLDYITTQNRKIVDFCEQSNLGMKQYLPHYTRREEWRAHFGARWDEFVQRKSAYDPLAILAPGHQIFQKAMPFS